MRIVGICAVLSLSACGLSLLAQQPQASQPTSAVPASQPTSAAQASTQPAGSADSQDSQLPVLTPEQQREQQIRQFDPLDRSDDKDSKEREKAARDAEKRRDQAQTPTPGSIAATERDQARPGQGPQVLSDDDTTEEPVQEYTGPAVLSRSYSVSRPLIPQQLKWTESVGVSAAYNSGVSQTINPNGSFSSAALVGTMLNWSLSGRHYFRHDQIAVNYTGSYSQYSGPGGYSGSNNSIAVDYSHVLGRRLTLNFTGLGSVLSQNYVLYNTTVGPETTVANINLASSPNIQITDLGTKQFSTQIDLVWQESARLSFDGGISYFAVERDAPGLLGMTGEQGRGDMNYRLTRKMTVGAYYSYSYYIFPQGFGTTHTNTTGAIFSYALNSTMQVRLRGGVSSVDSLEFQPVPIAPAIAVLLGQSTGLIDASTKVLTSDISAQFVKDFRGGKTATVAYAHGVSPGNGVFQTSEQQSISGSFTLPLFRVYTFRAAFGRDTLTAIGVPLAALGNYASEYGTVSVSRRFSRGVALNFAATFRHFLVSDSAILDNQLMLTSGLTWGPPGGRLWPF